jgi:pilus assembly protein CpaC
MFTRCFSRLLMPLAICAFWPAVAPADPPPTPLARPSIVQKIQSSNEKLEMTVHSSRILTMDQKIPQAQVNNPDILEVTPLSPTQVQISAKAPGVTQVNLWGEDKKVYTVDVIVFGDAQELAMVLRTTFPSAALKVTPVSNSVLISGFVDQAESIDRIVRIAEEYYPKVINNMTVGGVQLVLLHVKVMEVSRTKLRRLGFDFSKITGPNVVTSSPSGALVDTINTTPVTPATPPTPSAPWSPIVTQGLAPTAAGAGTFTFGIVNGASAFFGVLDALRRDNLIKIMAEPTLVTVSGRAASFNSGGEFPVPVPQSLGTTTIEWKKYGTQIDFVPIVLGNGKIRLEIRPQVSELDESRSITIGSITVPGLKSRDADTGVEMTAGQTLGIAGLVQSYTEAENSGLPWISEVPYLGMAFRKVHESTNEVETLILVTPELVDPMDACEVPPCGPGTQTTSPSDWELFMKGHLEVPKCCPSGGDGACPPGEPAPDEPPPDGMIQSPGEQIPTPPPSAGRKTAGPHSRYVPSKTTPSAAKSSAGSQDGPPGFIGPVGYDVVK